MENLWAESQGHWTCIAAPSKMWSPCQNIWCVSHPGPSFLNRSVNLQPGQLLHYCVWRELEPDEDKKTELRQSVACKMHTEAAREKETEDTRLLKYHSHISLPWDEFIIRKKAVLLCQTSESYETCLLFDVAWVMLQSDEWRNHFHMTVMPVKHVYEFNKDYSVVIVYLVQLIRDGDACREEKMV